MAYTRLNPPPAEHGDTIPGSIFLVKDLRATHPMHENNYTEFMFLGAAYDGVRQLVELGVVPQHERETSDAYLRRMADLYGFNYSRAVVDLTNFYLFRKDPIRQLPDGLAQDPSWQAFAADCNLYGDTFQDYMADQFRWASVFGFVGFLVDKPTAVIENRDEELRRGVYPYLAGYHPTAILDWEYVRDDVGRPMLDYIKLFDDDGRYRIWWRDHWELWEEPEENAPGEAEGILVDSGPNPLGEIPWVWMHNLKGRQWPMGVADLHEIARIDLSILRDLSQINEIVGYTAFPVMLMPMEEQGQDVEVGSPAVVEFDPENPQAKPEWLVPQAAPTIQALRELISKKAAEIYRIAHTGGLNATETSTAAKSGVALTAEFQQLNAKVTQKAINVEKAENMILYFWLRWQQMEQYITKSVIERPRDFDVRNLAQDLADALTAKTVVNSRTFKQEVEKSIARQYLQDPNDEVLKVIDEEIEKQPDDFDLPEGQEPGAPRENPFETGGDPTEDEAEE